MSTQPEYFTSAPGLKTCRTIHAGTLAIGGHAPLALIAGPCVLESRAHALQMAQRLQEIAGRLAMPLMFKASFDKANRTSISSYRGPGLEEGLGILTEIKEKTGLPILTDVHTEEQCAQAAKVVDMIQIPAFLCRQTDFVVAAGRSGAAVNVKKGQFLAPWDMKNIVRKLEESGCSDILLTDRGTSFGYGALISDFRGLPMMLENGYPVCFDATHSVQQPGGLGTSSGGQREYVPLLARAACAAGTNALFMETHDQPDQAMSDGPNMIPIDQLENVLKACVAMDRVLRDWSA